MTADRTGGCRANKLLSHVCLLNRSCSGACLRCPGPDAVLVVGVERRADGEQLQARPHGHRALRVGRVRAALALHDGEPQAEEVQDERVAGRGEREVREAREAAEEGGTAGRGVAGRDEAQRVHAGPRRAARRGRRARRAGGAGCRGRAPRCPTVLPQQLAATL
ncbi:hypothetical protein PHLGIDRAFT_513795, partial [Phlebiopsis gigantea 11061_1 CR5-6]